MSRRKEDVTCFLCDYWWLFLILILFIIAAFFTRKLWWNPLVPPNARILGTGDIQATMRWKGLNDLDLHVVDPTGEEIYYSHKDAMSGGSLDVDSNAACAADVTDQPVENIYWPSGKAPSGHYVISVVYFMKCQNPAPTDFTVTLKMDGKEQTFTGHVNAANDIVKVYEFTR